MTEEESLDAVVWAEASKRALENPTEPTDIKKQKEKHKYDLYFEASDSYKENMDDDEVTQYDKDMV